MSTIKGKLKICSRGHKYRSSDPCPICWPGRNKRDKKGSTGKDIWRRETPAALDVDAFIKISPKPTQTKLRQLRQIIRAAAPGAEEKISYKMPVYKYNGKWLVGFAGFKNHVSFFGMSGTFLEDYKNYLKGYITSKGTIRFPLDKPLPVTLIRQLIKARMKQNKAEPRK